MSDMRLRGSCVKALEPALELCMKIQRKSALAANEMDALGHQLGWYRRVFGPFGERRLFLYALGGACFAAAIINMRKRGEEKWQRMYRTHQRKW